jgi:hypothetical protein
VQATFQEQEEQGLSPAQGLSPEADPRLQPRLDYGTLRPGSDAADDALVQEPVRAQGKSVKLLLGLAGATWIVGFVIAMVAGHVTPGESFVVKPAAPASLEDARFLERLKPQTQAETLLEQAVGHSQSAVEQIAARVDRWQGKMQWTPQIASLTTAALNSSDVRVRESGIEVELAAYGLAKNLASLNYLLKTSDSRDHAKKIWALWALGLMANRGVEPERLVDVLTAHLKDSDADSRAWAAQGLAVSGKDRALQGLLETMRDDPSVGVRERAASGLAEAGMFTPDQRMTVVPQLISFAETQTPAVQAKTLMFRALAAITHQRLPDDARAWREWYEREKQ